MRNLLMIFVAITAVGCNVPADVVNNYYFPASQDEQSSEDPSTYVNLTVNIHIENGNDDIEIEEDTGFLDTGDTGFYDDDSADSGVFNDDTADTGIFDSEEFDTADSGLSDTADSGNEIVDTSTPDPTTSHPCDDPAVTVMNEMIMGPTVRSAFSDIVRILFTGGSKSTYLTDLTMTMASDDNTMYYDFDQIPDPADHVLYCSLKNKWDAHIAGPKAVANDGTLDFNDFEFLVYTKATVSLNLHCAFANVDVEGGDDDGYTAYVANVDDMVFVEAFTLNAVSSDEICMPNGLPNASLDSKITIMNNGELCFDQVKISEKALTPGGNAEMIDIDLYDAFEGIAVDDVHYEFTGNLSLVDSVNVVYADLNGAYQSLTGVPDLNGDIWFKNMKARDRILMWIEVNDYAQAGEEIQASFITQDTVAYGLTSGQTLDPSMDFWPLNDIESEIFTVPCSFDIPLSNGSIAQMQSDVQMWLSSSTPSGIYTPSSELEVLRYEVSADAGCTNDEVLVESMTFWLLATDNSGSGWTASNYIEIQDLSTGDMLYTGTISQGQPVPLTLDLAIPPGTTHTIGVFLDTIGASTFNDDCVRMYIEQDSLDWSDNQNVATNVEHEEILGNTICF